MTNTSAAIQWPADTSSSFTHPGGCRTGCVCGLTQVKKCSRWTDVERVRRVISLPKKAFKSFCTWMLLPTVLYTPSCVTPGREGRWNLKKKKKREREKEKGECNLDVSRAVEMYHMCLAAARIKIQMFQPDYGCFMNHLSLKLCSSCPCWVKIRVWGLSV